MENSALNKISYGMYLLSASSKDIDNACIINTFMQVSYAPLRVCICVSKQNYTHDLIKKSKRFNISVLTKNVSFDLIKRFGFQSGRDKNKFENFKYVDRTLDGIIYLTKYSNSYINVKVTKMINLGSHTMFIGDVKVMGILNEDESLTYDDYFKLVKPKDDNNKEKGKNVYRCRICGTEYVGDKMPSDYICPVCKHDASFFEKVN